MGLIRDRIGDIHITAASKTYPEVVQVINKYLSDRLPADMQDHASMALSFSLLGVGDALAACAVGGRAGGVAAACPADSHGAVSVQFC